VLLLVVAACAGAASFARPAAATSGWHQVTIPASDNTPLSCVYLIPDGSPPSGGFPGVILFHGLGQSYADMQPIGSAFAQFGIASLACDARGTGASGGKWGLDGPREVQDAQDLYDWLAADPNVSDTEIGAFGLSLGGGEVWNSAVAGVPFKAIVPAITWTSLANALNPNGVVKTGLVGILSQVVPLQNWDPALVQTAQSLLQGDITPGVTSTEASRSSRPQLHALTVPTLLLQGRHDFLFDMDQAIAAWKLLAGPKSLYFGDLGHPPAKNPTAEQPVYVTAAALWFVHYLAPDAKATPASVQLAHDPWDGKIASYSKLPTTQKASVNLPGKTKLTGGTAFATRHVRLPGGPHETFGDGFLTVHYSGARNWTHLVAMVSVKDSATPITEGAAPIKSASGVVKIPLMDEAVLVKRGKRLTVSLGSTSADNVNQVGVPIYASPAPQGASIKIGSVTLRLSFLKRAVSK
jgi:pimeloyl-ACP methyl ester carboxylesterase